MQDIELDERDLREHVTSKRRRGLTFTIDIVSVGRRRPHRKQQTYRPRQTRTGCGTDRPTDGTDDVTPPSGSCRQLGGIKGGGGRATRAARPLTGDARIRWNRDVEWNYDATRANTRIDHVRASGRDDSRDAHARWRQTPRSPINPHFN